MIVINYCIWLVTHSHHDHAGDSYTPAVTYSRMKLLGVKKNYSMSLGDGLLQ